MRQLIIGSSESGKSTLAKAFARELTKAKQTVIVMDYNNDPDWVCSYRTDDIDDFTSKVKGNRSCHLFIDEGGAVFREGHDTSNLWLATRIRHWGHNVTFISQMYTQIPMGIRTNCTRLYMFSSGLKHSMVMADEWNCRELMNANVLPKYHFYMVDRFGGFDSLKLTTPEGEIGKWQR